MFLRVENLGPLRSAEVDLSKELILLTGRNNTGKTYLAWSVFGLFRAPSANVACRALADEILASPKQEVEFERFRARWPDILQEIASTFTERLHLCFAAGRDSFQGVKLTLRSSPDEPEPRFRQVALLNSQTKIFTSRPSQIQSFPSAFRKSGAPLARPHHSPLPTSKRTFDRTLSKPRPEDFLG